MPKTMLTLLLFTLALSLFAQGLTLSTPEGNISMSVTGIPTDSKPASRGIIDAIVTRLEQLEKDYFIKLNKVDQLRAQKLVNEIYELLAQIPVSSETTVTSSTTTTTTTSTPNINININTPTPGEKPKPEKPDKPKPEAITVSSRKVMSDKDFNDLMAKIEKQSFSDDQLSTLELAAKNTRFKVNQIVRIIGAFTFADDKLEALRLSYPECEDPQNNYKILDAFTFSSDKEAAKQIIEGK